VPAAAAVDAGTDGHVVAAAVAATAADVAATAAAPAAVSWVSPSLGTLLPHQLPLRQSISFSRPDKYLRQSGKKVFFPLNFIL
jgi:hypothetical protein